MKPKNNIWIIFFIFLLLRLAFILTFPPFTDESLYIRWGQLMVWNPNFRFASILYHSRQPLAFWLFGLGSITLNNPLIGGRIISLLFSIPSFFALYFFMKKSFDKHSALLSILLLAISPLAIMFQSMALMDGMLFSSAFCVIYFLNEYRTHNSAKTLLKMSVILGILLWIKTTALFVVIPTIITTILVTTQNSSFARPGLAKLIIKIASVGLPLILISLPLVFLPNTEKILSEPGSFSFTVRELISLPIASWTSNGLYALYGYMIYFTPVVFLFGLIGAYMYRKEKTMMPFFTFGLTILFSIILGKIFRIRYALYAMIGIIPLASLFLACCSSSLLVRRLLYSICIGSSLLLSLILIIKPEFFFSLFPKNSFLSREREYAFGWTSGKAVKSLEKYMERMPGSVNKKRILLTEDAPGNPGDYLLARYYFDPSVIISPFDISRESLEKITDKTLKTPIYVITRSFRVDSIHMPNLKLLQSFSENEESEYLGLYLLTSP